MFVNLVLSDAAALRKSELAKDLKSWWNQECADWDAGVTGAKPASLPGGADLWDDMPVLDSKAVARTSPIFERHLGVPLDVKLIRPGGYESLEEMITDLVPPMLQVAAHSSGRIGKEDGCEAGQGAC